MFQVGACYVELHEQDWTSRIGERRADVSVSAIFSIVILTRCEKLFAPAHARLG